MLALSARYLNGFVAACEPDARERAEWPPHPGRVFMGLAAAHYLTGDDAAEPQTLGWLEWLTVCPSVRALGAVARARRSLEMRDSFGAFNRSDFREAERSVERLARRHYKPCKAECLVKLAKAYEAWNRFDFKIAQEALGEVRGDLDRFVSQGGWAWTGAVQAVFDENLRTLDVLVQIRKHPEPDEVEKYLAKAAEIIARACGRKDVREGMLPEYLFPRLQASTETPS